MKGTKRLEVGSVEPGKPGGGVVLVQFTEAYGEQPVAIALELIGVVRGVQLDKGLGRTSIQHRTNARRCWQVREHFDDVVARIRAAGGLIVGREAAET